MLERRRTNLTGEGVLLFIGEANVRSLSSVDSFISLLRSLAHPHISALHCGHFSLLLLDVGTRVRVFVCFIMCLSECTTRNWVGE